MSQKFKKFPSDSECLAKQNAYFVSDANGTTMLGPLLLKQKTMQSKADEDRIRHATTLHTSTTPSEQTGFKQVETAQVYALVSKETKLLSEISQLIGWDGATCSTSPGFQWVDRLETVDICMSEKIMATTGSSYIQTIKNNRKNSFSVQNIIPLNLKLHVTTEADQTDLKLTQPLKFPSNASTSYIKETGDERSKDVKETMTYKRGEETRTPEVDTNSKFTTFLSVNSKVTNVRPKVLPPERPPPVVPSPQRPSPVVPSLQRPPSIVPPPRSASLNHKTGTEEEPDEFVPELLNMKKISETTPPAGREITISADHNKHGQTDQGAKKTVNLPVRAVSTSGPHFFTAHNIDVDFKKRISSKLSEPLPGDEEDEDSHKNKRGTNPLKKFFARKKGKYDPSVDSEIFESTLPSSGSQTRDAKKKKKDLPKKKLKDKEKKSKKSEQTKPKLTKDEIVVVKSSGKCLTDLNFSPDSLELDMSQSPELDKSHKVVNKQHSTSDEGSDGSKSSATHDEYNEVDEEDGGVYANFPTVLRRKVGNGHRVDPPTVPSMDSSASDPENEYNEPEDEDKVDEQSSQSQDDESIETADTAETTETTDEDVEEIYVNTLMLAKMNKPDTPSKSPSSVSSEESSSNSGHQGCYVVNHDEQMNEHTGNDMTVTGTEDSQVFTDDSSFSTAPSEILLQNETTELNFTSLSVDKKCEDPSKGLKRFGTIENLNLEGNNSNLVKQDSQEVALEITKSNSKLEDNKTLVGNVSVIKLKGNETSKDKTDIDDTIHALIPAGVEHKEVFLQPDNVAQISVHPMTMSHKDIKYQNNEVQLVENVSTHTKQKNSMNIGLKENKETGKSVGKKVMVNTPIISGNLKVNEQSLKLEQINTTHLRYEDSNRVQARPTVKQDLHLDINNDAKTKSDEKILHEKGNNMSVKMKDKSDIQHDTHKKLGSLTSTVTNKSVIASPGTSSTKPPVPPPTKPKPPAWKMKELMSHQEHQQNISLQSAPITPKAQLTSRGSEESINKTLIAGALKELDDFIDNEIEQEDVSKEPVINSNRAEEDYEKFIVSHKNIVTPNISEQTQNTNTDKANIAIVDEKPLSINPTLSIVGSSELGRYERVISCTIDNKERNITSKEDHTFLNVNPSTDRGYEDVIDNISAEKIVDHKDMEKIYDEIGDSDDDNLSPTSRCFKFHWKRKEREQSVKKEDSDQLTGNDRNVRESKERKKSNKTKEENGDKVKKDKKRKKKDSGDKRSRSKKDSRQEKSQSHGDGVEGVSSSTSGESEYSDYEVMAEIRQDKEHDNVMSDQKSKQTSSESVSPHAEKDKVSDKIRIGNADSYGYEIPSKLDASSNILDDVKMSPTKINKQSMKEDLSCSVKIKSETVKNQAANDTNIGAKTSFVMGAPKEQLSLQEITKETNPASVETLKGTENTEINIKLSEKTMAQDNFVMGSVSISHSIPMKNKPTPEKYSTLHETNPVDDTTLIVKEAREIEEPRHTFNPAIFVQNKLSMFQTKDDVDKIKQEHKSDKNKKEKKTIETRARNESSTSSSDSSTSDQYSDGGTKKRKKKQIKVSISDVGQNIKLDGHADFFDNTTQNKKEKEIKENKLLIEDKKKKKDDKSTTFDVGQDAELICRKEKNREENTYIENEIHNSHFNLPKPKIELQAKDTMKNSIKDRHPEMDIKINTELSKSPEPMKEDNIQDMILPSSKKPIREIDTIKINEEKGHIIAIKATSPDKMKSNTNEMKDTISPVQVETYSHLKPGTTDAVSSVFQIPYVQSFSEIDDDHWKDYSALELGVLTKSMENSTALKTDDNIDIWQKRKTPDTADRTTSLPPDHVAPPVPRVRSKIGLVNEAGDILRLPKKPDVKPNVNPSGSHKVSVPVHEELDSEIYADGTSESKNCDGPLNVNITTLNFQHKTDLNDNNRANDDKEDSTEEKEIDGRDYDHVPVRLRKLVNAKPVYPGVMVSSTTTPIPASRTTSGELSHTKRSTKGPHSGGPEYALPWEDKKLGTLAPTTALGSVAPVTVSSRSSSEPSSEIDSFSGARMSYTSEDINDEIGFGMGDRHETKKLDPNTKSVSKHKMSNQDGKKGNRLKAITSIFHRKKKDKQETNENDDDNDDDQEGDDTEDKNVSESKKKKKNSEKSDHKKRKPEKSKKTEKQKLHKGTKSDRLSSEIDSESLEMTSPDLMEREPLCRLIKINDDGSKVMEMVRPQSEPLGIFFKKGPETHKEGLVVKSFLDKHAKRLFAGLLRVGDEIVEIDDDDICHLTLDEIKELIQQKERMVLKLRAIDYMT